MEMSEKMSEKVSQKGFQKSDKEDTSTDFLDNENLLIEKASMSDLEKDRFRRLLNYMIALKKYTDISSAKAAKILNIEQKTASRLLAKAEKSDLLESEGKTKGKVYKLKRIS